LSRETTPGAESQDLTGKERQELGSLRQEKEKWDASIKAAVHATLFFRDRGGKIIKDALKDELHRFGLPDTTVEKIRVALREKGLTHGPGRPKKESKYRAQKNP